MDHSFRFVCQAGPLEPKAALLAASLRRYMGTECECLAAIPAGAPPSAATLALLRSLGVRTRTIVNPLAADYPIGHKIACLDLPTRARKRVFLDTDMLCLRAFSPQPRFQRPGFHAKPADLLTYGADPEHWRRVYGLFGLPPPPPACLTSVSQQATPPYFNAGFIAVDARAPLAAEWTAVCRRLDADPAIPNKRPWLDQIGLPVAVRRLGLAIDYLDERYNFPAHLKPLPADLPWCCHYHAPEVLLREPVLHEAVCDLLAAWPSLRAILDRHEAWRPFLSPPRVRFPVSAPGILITGIPRSGTSFLCRTLAAVRDSVVLNEPEEILPPLGQGACPPWEIPLLYQRWRRAILEGRPLPNKVDEKGLPVADTRLEDRRRPHLPAVARADFLLGSKNTLAYLACLPGLRHVMPGAAVLACIRHPADTIASWKRSFPHLREVDLAGFPPPYRQWEWLPPGFAHWLRIIEATPSAALRRALLWRLLAEHLWREKGTLHVFRYEEWVCDPAAHVERVWPAFGAAFPCRWRPSLRPAPSTPRRHRQVLDREDWQALEAVCAETARLWGYFL